MECECNVSQSRKKQTRKTDEKVSEETELREYHNMMCSLETKLDGKEMLVLWMSLKDGVPFIIQTEHS